MFFFQFLTHCANSNEFPIEWDRSVFDPWNRIMVSQLKLSNSSELPQIAMAFMDNQMQRLRSCFFLIRLQTRVFNGNCILRLKKVSQFSDSDFQRQV